MSLAGDPAITLMPQLSDAGGAWFGSGGLNAGAGVAAKKDGEETPGDRHLTLHGGETTSAHVRRYGPVGRGESLPRYQGIFKNTHNVRETRHLSYIRSRVFMTTREFFYVLCATLSRVFASPVRPESGE